jgi:hypothetical protein
MQIYFLSVSHIHHTPVTTLNSVVIVFTITFNIKALFVFINSALVSNIWFSELTAFISQTVVLHDDNKVCFLWPWTETYKAVYWWSNFGGLNGSETYLSSNFYSFIVSYFVCHDLLSLAFIYSKYYYNFRHCGSSKQILQYTEAKFNLLVIVYVLEVSEGILKIKIKISSLFNSV